MITRLSFRPESSASAGLSCQCRRWISYPKEALTKDSLHRKVETGLNDGYDGANLRVDMNSKSMLTAAGDLPMSPLFNPDWMMARRRLRKDAPSKPMGRFRRKLANNPYAQALATPIRRCANTTTSLPRFFLQDFELVKHPSDTSVWWAPGPLAFENLEKRNKAHVSDMVDSADTHIQASSNREGSSSSASSVLADKPLRTRSPITTYALSRKSVIDKIGDSNRKHAAILLAVRTGMAVAPDTRNAVWRQDMGHVLLQMMRRHATDALLSSSNPEGQDSTALIQACQDWGGVKNVDLRGCVLWLPPEDDTSPQYATLDLEGSRYGGKTTVHNLHWLLGESEVQRLRSMSELFSQNEILVLRQWKSRPIMNLHLLLWRLKGYLAQSVAL
ncbi:hypothetical protein QQS21_005975 [Conoideocrella luteorostrata]|uniref:Uncharacterized protein n=1 Tax=Conoideocrella luteorostrata TaxID=1105319 RepID=A0AAJ0CSQ0_9HYPO|nr:hypothetical protein QQS21_005975 [Conoideocrella luteorostrata]